MRTLYVDFNSDQDYYDFLESLKKYENISYKEYNKVSDIEVRTEKNHSVLTVKESKPILQPLSKRIRL
jgi:hypothetical protein